MVDTCGASRLRAPNGDRMSQPSHRSPRRHRAVGAAVSD